jgi:hypothetical protein
MTTSDCRDNSMLQKTLGERPSIHVPGGTEMTTRAVLEWINRVGAKGTTSPSGSLIRTPSWRASTTNSGTNALVSRCLRTLSRDAASSSNGAKLPTRCSRTRTTVAKTPRPRTDGPRQPAAQPRPAPTVARYHPASRGAMRTRTFEKPTKKWSDNVLPLRPNARSTSEVDAALTKDWRGVCIAEL